MKISNNRIVSGWVCCHLDRCKSGGIYWHYFFFLSFYHISWARWISWWWSFISVVIIIGIIWPVVPTILRVVIPSVWWSIPIPRLVVSDILFSKWTISNKVSSTSTSKANIVISLGCFVLFF